MPAMIVAPSCSSKVRVTSQSPTREVRSAPPARARRAVTLDLYGHMLPGAEDEAAGLLDAYIARAAVAQTVAQSEKSLL
jgi:hypothetical protein